MLFIMVVSLVLLSLAFIVYLLYYISIYRRTSEISKYQKAVEHVQKSNIDLPPVSVIVNTYNEAKIIRRKIENISRFDYPLDKLEVLVIDDCSVDETGAIAERALAEFKIKGRVLRNSVRLGLNASLNLAIANASNDLVCVTDSDVLLDSQALKNAVSVLEGFPDVGGVTGKIVPIYSEKSVATLSEDSYRVFYDRCMLSESSIHSAFPGNGPLMVFRKELVNSIPEGYGSTDANIAITVVKGGKRMLYVPNALIYELVPETVGQQRLQKIRRAKRLIQVFTHNFGVFGKRKFGAFGTVIFPLKFFMHVVCPFLFFLGTALFLLAIALSNSLLLQGTFLLLIFMLLVALAAASRFRRLFFSFVLHQAYLFAGLLLSFRKSVYWQTVKRV